MSSVTKTVRAQGISDNKKIQKSVHKIYRLIFRQKIT